MTPHALVINMLSYMIRILFPYFFFIENGQSYDLSKDRNIFWKYVNGGRIKKTPRFLYFKVSGYSVFKMYTNYIQGEPKNCNSN